MATSAPMVAHTPVKRERSPSLDQILDAPSPKRQVGDVSGVVRTSVEFPWRTCETLSDVERLKIKEKAVIEAEKYCEQVRTVLGSVLKIPHDSTESIMMGRRIVKHWCDEHDQIRNKHKQRQILVGVEGPTGAGKSSFLGSLLKISELFPSGQESAATAVIGKVSWNWNDSPGYEFRAEVFFRPKIEVVNELKELLQELVRWTRLTSGQGQIEEDDNDGERADTMAICRSAIEHQLPRVKAVWGMEEEQLQQLANKTPQHLSYKDAIRKIFYRNITADRFLDNGKVEFNASTAKDISASIKPFLDSSPSTHGGGKQFSAWPLVKCVHIYAKADILKPGITLVDLPGCGDAVESRSEVAQKVSHTLDVRMVVSPIIRATDEKQGQALMQNGFDEAQMRIRGKLDGRGFCVVASKMDDMKVDSYITGCPELTNNQELNQKETRIGDLKQEKEGLKQTRRDLKTARKQAERQKNKASKAYEKAMKKHALKLQANPNESGAHLTDLEAERDARAQAFNDADKQLKRCEFRKTQIETETTYLHDWLHHRAYQTRNARVMERLRANFAMRQTRLDEGNTPVKPRAAPEYVLPILPVSTRAFWQLESTETPMPGFPSLIYTGVPAAEKWLHQATLAKREKHLDETLDGYQNLMTMMRIYSATNGQNGDINLTRSEVENALAETHAFYTKKLGSKLAEACTEINKLDPVEHKDRAKKRFLREACRIVQKWGYKFPDIENNVEKMHFCTYGANIRRMGRTYRSAGSGVTYTWIENLAAPILKTLSRDWDRKMNRQLPLIKRPMVSDYSRIFTEYLDAIQRVINDKVPPLGACFESMRPILENSQRAMSTKIGDVLSTLAEKSALVTVDAVVYLHDEMRPTFEAAAADVGTGCHARRQETIKTKIEEDADFICEEMIKRLVNGVAGRKAEVPAQLRDAAAEGPRIIVQQLSFLVNNLVENISSDPKMKAKKLGIPGCVRAHIEGWEASWAKEGDYEAHILDQDLEIPANIPEPVIREAPESDDEAVDDSSDDEDDTA
ncbi:hypothetical protein NW752_009231 [Fusarium irregulare]|uniref:Nuclear GTPase SLIP-GC n=1 Tax=Fusarium irregulare TaxID=2494466 RepID=A0A9W8U7S3_9HYPO|nr:hypothetical protein NW766_008764 [Fusarium irregulare]KAJ4010054.1 hypothetical protein NW752_009231 [Fusarium irregulare]